MKMEISFREKIFSLSLVVFGGGGLCILVYSFAGLAEYVIPYALVTLLAAVCAIISKPGKT